LPLPEKDILKIIEEVDYFGNGKINYTEFLVATLDMKIILDNNKLKAVFQQFDSDNTGQITKDNII
jgi:Ca2+-binding EF-hand superfamily protein